MDAIKEQVGSIVDSWGRTMEKAAASPSSWQPYLPNSSLAQVDEAVQTMSFWFNRVRAPNGFAPGFHVARAVAAATLPSLTSTAQQLESGQYNHLPSFLVGILTLLNALHTMVVFSQKEEGAAAVGDLAAELSQALALINTAQSELAAKVERLTAATATADKVDAVYEEVEEKQGQCAAAMQEAQESCSATAVALTEAKSSAKEVAELSEKLQTLVSDGDRTRERLVTLTAEAEELKKKCTEQQTLIDSLLPKGASAGLAAAFAARGGMLEKTKWIWMGVFVCSLLALGGFAYHLSDVKPPEGATYWSFALYRMTLAAPLVWLAWFSAIQYGNTVRVQEDYAFKEATSKAFQGYRDHMEHLASVDDEEAGSAMSLMAQRTIEILAREPLRIFGRTHHDASPASGAASILERLRGKASPKAGGAED